MLSTKLRSLREEASLKQSELASALGIAVSSLSSYELGNTAPNTDVLKKICEYFDVSADWLLGIEASSTLSSPSDVIDLIFDMRKLGAIIESLKIKCFDEQTPPSPYYITSAIMILLDGIQIDSILKNYDNFNDLIRKGTIDREVRDTWLKAEQEKIRNYEYKNDIPLQLSELLKKRIEEHIFELSSNYPFDNAGL